MRRISTVLLVAMIMTAIISVAQTMTIYAYAFEVKRGETSHDHQMSQQEKIDACSQITVAKVGSDVFNPHDYNIAEKKTMPVDVHVAIVEKTADEDTNVHTVLIDATKKKTLLVKDEATVDIVTFIANEDASHEAESAINGAKNDANLQNTIYTLEQHEVSIGDDYKFKIS